MNYNIFIIVRLFEQSNYREYEVIELNWTELN